MSSVILRSINKNSTTTPISPSKSFEVKIELPVTLGRGPIIKCPDKKISRNHVMIDWDDEGVLITSTHVKSTFILRNGEEKSLTQGQSAVLNNGDSFGLLEDRYWYKVIIGSSCSDEYVTDSKKIEKESPPCSKNEQKQSSPCSKKIEKESSPCSKKVQKESSPCNKKIQKELSPCLSSTESPTDENENKHIGADSNEDHLTLEKDNDIKEENVESLIINNTNTESNKIGGRIEETDEKVEIKNNLSENNYNPNNRKRTLPNWMSKPAGKVEPYEKKSNGKVKNLNKKQSTKENAARPSKKATALSKFHDCSDDDSDDHDVKISPKKPTKRANQRQIKQTNPKNQYHTVSQDFDSPDLGIEDNVCEVISKDESKTNINAGGCSDSDDRKLSPKKESKRTNQRQIKKTNAKNQYHEISQEFDSPDFETKENVSEAANQNEIKANINAAVSSDSDDDKVLSNKGTRKVNLETVNNVSEVLSKKDVKDVKANSANVSDLEEVTSLKKEHHLSDDDSDGGRDEPSGSKPSKIKISKELKKNSPRKPCQYGEDCYRNNPKHREEMAHPGDSDYASYKSESDDDDDDRPECEYGLNCYRKNPQHRKAFKHTKKPQPQRNAKRKGKRKNDELDDSDEYDFDDSFLNDDSSDDYNPTDSSAPDSDIEDAVEEDDTKRMMKEAKKFVKKRKH